MGEGTAPAHGTTLLSGGRIMLVFEHRHTRHQEPHMSDQGTTKAPERVRKPVRLHPDTAQHVAYWSTKRDLSENEYMALAIEEKIARENGDYELPTLEQYRLNQLVDEIHALSSNTANLERVVTSGFGSLLNLTSGDSYLMDEENGELGIPDTASSVAGG
jgi:hypothetical protein